MTMDTSQTLERPYAVNRIVRTQSIDPRITHWSGVSDSFPRNIHKASCRMLPEDLSFLLVNIENMTPVIRRIGTEMTIMV